MCFRWVLSLHSYLQSHQSAATRLLKSRSGIVRPFFSSCLRRDDQRLHAVILLPPDSAHSDSYRTLAHFSFIPYIRRSSGLLHVPRRADSFQDGTLQHKCSAFDMPQWPATNDRNKDRHLQNPTRVSSDVFIGIQETDEADFENEPVETALSLKYHNRQVQHPEKCD